jgi:hypothetical protein
MSTKLIILIGCLLMVVVVLAIVSIPTGNKEGFFATPLGARVAEETGAIRGNGILTDGVLDGEYKDITQSVRETGYAQDGTKSLGAVAGDGFDSAYQNQLQIMRVTDSAVDGYHSTEDLVQQSKYLNTSANSSNNNMFSKAHSRPTKMTLNPGEHHGVIAAKYLPERERNRQIGRPDSAIEIPGYDINIERLGQEFVGVTTSAGSVHRKRRIPTSGGGMTPTSVAVGSIVSQQNGQLALNDQQGNTILTPLENTEKQTFKPVYAKRM